MTGSRTLGVLTGLLLATVHAAPAPAQTVYPHIVNLNSVPGSVGNGTLFTGSVCWIGIIGSGNCFPGYGNNVSQAAFKSFNVGSGWSMTYRFRSDSQGGSDVTYLIVDRSGLCPVLQSSGFYAYVSLPGQRDTLTTFEGGVEGNDFADLSMYSGMTVCVSFNSVSDASGSDEDCMFPTKDGLFEFDHVQIGPDLTTFDSGPNGWTFGAVGPVVGPPTATPVTGPVANVAILISIGVTALILFRKNSA